jgi:hypothetical protein
VLPTLKPWRRIASRIVSGASLLHAPDPPNPAMCRVDQIGVSPGRRIPTHGPVLRRRIVSPLHALSLLHVQRKLVDQFGEAH